MLIACGPRRVVVFKVSNYRVGVRASHMLNVPIGPFCGNDLQPTHPIGSEELLIMRTLRTLALCCAFVLALMPATAFAESDSFQPASAVWGAASSSASGNSANDAQATSASGVFAQRLARLSEGTATFMETAAKSMSIEHLKQNRLLAYDQADIAAIGSQEHSGHTICCPSYACAYADAVLDGTVHDHDYYTCSCCSWADWGGGDSSFRSVGTDEQLLREAYDQISAGRPTVVHVTWSGGEHWIALIGFENAADPDHLTLANFIALDPWDGAQLNAGSKYDLYGDGCEHVSDR